ncbi:MAG: hypothetical protein K9G05_00835 [Candidatus Nanopelagicales bacterium]|nr:hypothetical protein [Candidatus Nanopelagicales bacterium]MCF8550611.1 hypothetical protein [Candidatus Nanopelagicales bacterium]
MADTSTLTPPALSAADRCDRCGAQAYVLVELNGGSTLQFCGHHWSTHESALSPQATRIINELHRLSEPAQQV